MVEKIETTRCYLSELTAEDEKDAIKIYTDDETRKFLGGPMSVQEATKKFQSSIDSEETIWTVRLKETHTFIGLIEFSPYHDPLFYELSYEFLPEFWGNGYAFEVMEACLNFCKNRLGLDKVFAETQKKNLKSRRLLEKLGYQLEKELVRFHEQQTVYCIQLSLPVDPSSA